VLDFVVDEGVQIHGGTGLAMNTSFPKITVEQPLAFGTKILSSQLTFLRMFFR
jgi:hypothetical protein